MGSTTLERNVAEQVAHEVSIFLADTYILYVKTQNFHWNIIDPRFSSLHELLDKEYHALADAIDEIAERIRMLNCKSPGSMKRFLELSNLKESGPNLSGDEMLKELIHDNDAIIQWLHAQTDQINDLGDQGTGDMMIQRLRAHEKTLWMLRSFFPS